MTSPRNPVQQSKLGRRGQSNVIGFVLVIGIVLVGSTVVLTLGSATLSDSQQSIEMERAEKILTEFDSRSAIVALGDAESVTMELPRTSGSSYSVVKDSGWIRVNRKNMTNGDVETLTNVTMGAVTYRNDRKEVAYQGGGVWRKSAGNSSLMVSPPEFHYRDSTLTLPIVALNTTGASPSRIAVEQNGTASPVYPSTTEDRANPLQDSRIEVTVKSEYYQAWAVFFEERTDGKAELDHENGTATIELIVPKNRQAVSGGIVSGAAGSELVIGNNMEADSFNSTVGNYDSSNEVNSSLLTSGHLKMENNALIEGDVIAGKDAVLNNNAKLDGNLSYGGDLDEASNAEITGWSAQNASVEEPTEVSGLINAKLDIHDEASENDNNTDSSDIQSLEDETCSSTCDLVAGVYYLETLDLGEDQTLELDTSGGNIVLVVDGDIDLNNKAVINVTGGNRVNIYSNGDFTLSQNGDIEVKGDRAPNLWIYQKPGSSANIENNANFTGVVYGPGSEADDGSDITISQTAHVYGAVVGHITDASENFKLHYDEALLRTDPIVDDSPYPSVTYLHVSINKVNVTST